MHDHQARGRQFEELLARLLTESQFRVTRNPGVASPRQTDLLASKNGVEYVIEAKWQRPPVALGDLDSHRARLGRASGNIVGVIVSMSGFTQTVLDEMAANRSRIILLFNADEMHAIVRGTVTFDLLLRDKRDAFVREGRVFFWSGSSPWSHLPTPNLTALPSPNLELRGPTGKVLPWVSGQGEFLRIVFTQYFRDVNWIPAMGTGVGFELGLVGVDDPQAVAHIINTLHDMGWISPQGTYSIQQSETSWHGVGANGFVTALRAFERRYRDQCGHIHHSEEATYCDLCPHGMFTLSVDMSANGALYRRIELSALLFGVPLDLEPFRRLAITFRQADSAYFRPLNHGPRTVWFKSEIKVNRVALLCDPRGWVGGIVIRNPFYKQRLFAEAAIGSDVSDLNDEISALERQELVVCGLSSWHEVDDAVDYYYLRHVEVVRTYDAAVWSIFCDWHALTDKGTVTP